MKTTSYYPVIQVGDVQASARFYVENLNFRAVFDSDWYVHLQSKDDECVNLAILKFDHETIPETARHPPQGLILNFEVEDVLTKLQGLHDISREAFWKITTDYARNEKWA